MKNLFDVTFDVTSRTFNVSNDDNLTDLILCLKNGHNLGTNTVKLSLQQADSELLMETREDNKFITLFVEAVKSSNSNNVSQSMFKTAGN